MIQRYDVRDGDKTILVPEPDGGRYVLHADHEAELQQAREELAEARRKIEGFIEPIESLEECENCECLFHPDALQATADDVKLCPKCYEVCCREYEAIAPPEVKP